MTTSPTTPRNPLTVIIVVMAVMVLPICSNSRAEAKSLSYSRYHSNHVRLPAEWHAWKSVHGKTYDSQREELTRHAVWQANKKFIEAHNEFNQTFGYTLAMNELGDMVSFCVELENRTKELNEIL